MYMECHDHNQESTGLARDTPAPTSRASNMGTGGNKGQFISTTENMSVGTAANSGKNRKKNPS